MATVFDVAKYIVDSLGKVTTMKLQKLVYYSQAWNLAWDDVPILRMIFRRGRMALFARHYTMSTKDGLLWTEVF